MIDDARVWNRALTGTEIRKWMRTELGSSTGVYSGLVLSLIFQSSVNNAVFNLYDFSNNNNIAANRGGTAASFANRPYTYATTNDCVLLGGAGDYLAAPSTTDLNITGSFTLECWVDPTNVASPSFQILISKRSLTASNGYDMYLNGGKIAIRTNGSTRLTGSTTIPSRGWSHIAATFNSSSGVFSVYVNGNLDGSATVTGAAPTTNPDSLFIGHGFNSDYAGFVDEVRIIPVVRTQQEIRSFMTRSMEYSNGVSGSVGYNLDGIAFVNTNLNGAPALQFRGNAAFAAVSTVSNQPLSPLNRADAQNFPQGFYMKYSNRRIPQVGTSGPMIPDNLFISQSVTVSDLNFYLATNHTFDSDMDITLVAPTGDSVNVCFDYSMVDQNDNIVTLFDDQADSSLFAGGPFTSVAPRIRPQGGLNSAFSGRNAQGWWKLKLTDDASGDTGRVYFWGVQINNQSLVGVEEVAGLTPKRFTLDQNYPNPFNPTTNIQFSVPVQSVVKVKVFDILGRELRTLVNEPKNPGTYKVQLDGTGLATGTYFYRMEAGSYIETKKMLLLK